jgi:ABC-type dipeptide/oligopeptide/nickel transport system permease component
MAEQESAASRAKARGMINPGKVRLVTFSIISICILACTVISILGVWDYTRGDTVWRAFATFLIVALASFVFALVNERFGD